MSRAMTDLTVITTTFSVSARYWPLKKGLCGPGIVKPVACC